ncbi:acyl-CoA dehydrogenase [Mycolicibacterium chitae]|uniref:Acyl-CoA dehydrogenase FadE18_1 n=1 Tax=Mycolicibacterium chitae TaxID=1792 RepID=A0A3S4RUM5_MYCCI|nr:acyl-CoA dehydrogenase family protein [Mycolicibacterium chitae]MCV7105088.1 acyl-CoA/acyl-ACP dehydrogenase [Mycolicibacterium chitae]BBZ05631.1 acyl-CoA dehydrogenase [Mycolicibacterium chitae]VEG49243.1 acyl-CoA dehydrogenase FadE18_1 [Mycolicibacterium chitae]
MSGIATPDTGDLLYSDTEDELRASVRALLTKSAPWDAVLARTESPETTDSALWRALVHEVGCTALSVSEQFDGGGASWREVAVVAEELGRAVAPVPFLGHSLAIALLQELQQTELLGRLARGELTATVAIPFGAPAAVPGAEIEVTDGRLSGTIRTVADALVADVLLVPVADAVYVVAAHADGLSRNAIVSLDMTRPLADLVLDGVAATPATTNRDVAAALTRTRQIGSALLASEQLGAAEKCLEMTVEYLLVRRQFARTIGSYQALKHRAADVWVAITQAKAVARYAAECAATDSADLPVAAALAKAHCSEVVQQAAEECLQLHGGIGFTWEHPTHLYLKRAKSSALALGGPAYHRGVLSTLIDLDGADQ